MPELLDRKRYSSDLDDAEWSLIAPLIPPLRDKGWGAAARWHRRDIVDAIFYVLKTGCSWRDLPGDFPDWNSVWKWFRRWRKDGTWGRVHDALRRDVRVAEGHDPEPSAAILDSQSIKGTEYTTAQHAESVPDPEAIVAALTSPGAVPDVTPEQIAAAILGADHQVPAEQVPTVVAAAILGVGEAPARPFPKARDVAGFNGDKKIKGRKRHLLVDTLGLVQSVVVHGADVADSVGASLVLARRAGTLPRLRKIWADLGYQGPLGEWVRGLWDLDLEIVRRVEEVRGFVVLKWRWIVERTHGWLGRFRRLNRGYDRLAVTDETMVQVAMIRLMLRRLAHPERETFRGTVAFQEAA